MQCGQVLSGHPPTALWCWNLLLSLRWPQADPRNDPQDLCCVGPYSWMIILKTTDLEMDIVGITQGKVLRLQGPPKGHVSKPAPYLATAHCSANLSYNPLLSTGPAGTRSGSPRGPPVSHLVGFTGTLARAVMTRCHRLGAQTSGVTPSQRPEGPGGGQLLPGSPCCRVASSPCPHAPGLCVSESRQSCWLQRVASVASRGLPWPSLPPKVRLLAVLRCRGQDFCSAGMGDILHSRWGRTQDLGVLRTLPAPR